MFILCSRKERTKKRAKGSNTPWIPATRKLTLRYFGSAEMGAPLIFARKYANSVLALAF
jgi:hypothetical protein